MAKFDLSLLPARPDLTFEAALWAAGIQYAAGVDEAGRGPLAGPVSAAAVVLPADPGIAETLCGVNDSKKLSPEARDSWAQVIRQVCLSWAVAFATVEEIDQIGIAPATRLAMHRAISGLAVQPDHVLIDYVLLPDLDLPQTALIKGDARSLSIAAASILAKTARDAAMREAGSQFPGYGFASHKGYGTRGHLQAIASLGPCALHRLTFEPVRHLIHTEKINP